MSKSPENQKYALYRCAFHEIAKDYKKATKKGHRLDELEAFGKAFNLIDRYHNNNMVGILANELEWVRRGRETIFPESERLVTQLLDSTADIQDANGLQMPLDAFMLAIPEGMTHKGVRITPSLVLNYPVSDLNKRVVPEFIKDAGITENFIIRFPPHTKGRRIYYILQWSEIGRPFIYMFLDSEIPAIMMAKDYREGIAALSFNYESSADGVDYQSAELQEQFWAVKLACSLGIYHAATNATCLVEGLPSTEPPRRFIAGGWSIKGLQAQTLKSPPVDRNSPDAHYRNFHYRNLSDPRFYRGEHANKPIGSRWVFVRPTVVGDVKPYTMIENGEEQ